MLARAHSVTLLPPEGGSSRSAAPELSCSSPSPVSIIQVVASAGRGLFQLNRTGLPLLWVQTASAGNQSFFMCKPSLWERQLRVAQCLFERVGQRGSVRVGVACDERS